MQPLAGTLTRRAMGWARHTSKESRGRITRRS